MSKCQSEVKVSISRDEVKDWGHAGSR